jgi:hypothetical protein
MDGKSKKSTPPPTPKAPKPWDVPPYPLKGDAVAETTYAAVGRALSAWEVFERVLSHIFAGLVSDRDDDLPALRAYGSIVTFRGRTEMIRAAAEAYFAAYPNPGGHTLLKKLLDDALEFSGRRNEIAHGFVNGWRPEQAPKSDHGFVLMPFHYSPRKSKFDTSEILMQSSPRRPVLRQAYIYSSKEIDAFRVQFESLARHAQNLSIGIRVLRHPDEEAARGLR